MKTAARGDATTIGLVALAHGMSHFFQLVVPPLFPFLKADFGVSYAALGFAIALFYAVSALCQPVAGFVVDRFGARGVLFGGLGLQVLGVLVVALTHGYSGLVFGAAVMGLGNSVFHPADFSIINARVRPERLGYAYSAHGIAGSLGYAAAPVFSGGLGALFGWHVALACAAGAGVAVLALLAINARRLQITAESQGRRQAPFAQDVRVLIAAPVLLCFAYFAVYAAGLTGLQSFSVTAMTVLYGVPAALASGALTAYMVGSASGILAGGFIAARTARHDVVAMSGLAVGSAAMLVLALGSLPGAALPVLMALAGFSVGATGPSRDLIVRASTPAGATGRVYGFVYSGLDFGSLSTPVFYGWLMDHGLPQGVFYTVFILTALAIFTVLQLPGRTRREAVPSA